MRMCQTSLSPTPPVLSDPQLVVNAVKFTTHGGVYVRVRRSANRGGGDQIVFVVKDTGIGIEQRVWRNCFSPSRSSAAPVII